MNNHLNEEEQSDRQYRDKKEEMHSNYSYLKQNDQQSQQTEYLDQIDEDPNQIINTVKLANGIGFERKLNLQLAQLKQKQDLDFQLHQVSSPRKLEPSNINANTLDNKAQLINYEVYGYQPIQNNFDLKEGHQIQLVLYNQFKKQYEINPEALTEIQKYEGIVNFILVQGSNAVINQLINSNFTEVNDPNSKLFNVFIWSEPLFNDLQNQFIFFIYGFFSNNHVDNNFVNNIQSNIKQHTSNLIQSQFEHKQEIKDIVFQNGEGYNQMNHLSNENVENNIEIQNNNNINTNNHQDPLQHLNPRQIEDLVQKNQQLQLAIYMLSSFYILNHSGELDDKIFQQLQFLSKVNSDIRIKVNNSELGHLSPQKLKQDIEQTNKSHLFAPFVCLVKDYQIQYDQFIDRQVQNNQYLEKFIQNKKMHQTNENNYKIIQNLAKNFKDRELIFYKKSNKSIFNESQSMNYYLRILREQILSKTIIKQLSGVNLNQRMITNLLVSMIQLINNQLLPFDIDLLWEQIIENECIIAHNEAIDVFLEVLREFFQNDQPKSQENIYQIFKIAREFALDKYHNLVSHFQENPYNTSYKQKLRDYLDLKENQAILTNDQLSQIKCEEHFDAVLEQIIQEQGFNQQEHHKLVNEFITSYLDQPNISEKSKQEVFKSKFQQLHKSIADKQEKQVITIESKYKQEVEQLIQKHQNEIRLQHAEIEKIQNNIKNLKQENQNQQQKIESQNKEMKNQNEVLSQEQQRQAQLQERLLQEQSKLVQEQQKLIDLTEANQQLQKRLEEQDSEIQKLRNKKACCQIF